MFVYVCKYLVHKYMYIHVVGDVYSVCLLDCVGGDADGGGATADRPTGGSEEDEEEDEEEERMFIAFSCAQLPKPRLR